MKIEPVRAKVSEHTSHVFGAGNYPAISLPPDTDIPISTPVLVIPLDSESIAEMREKVLWWIPEDCIDGAFTALGITEQAE